MLWHNKAPNSAFTQRPLAVIGAKEDTEDTLRPFIPQIEADITAVFSDEFDMTCMGKDIHGNSKVFTKPTTPVNRVIQYGSKFFNSGGL